MMLICLTLLIREVFRPDVLPLGASLPRMWYRSGSGIAELGPDPSIHTCIIIHRPDCPYCHYFLKELENHVQSFSSARLFIWTDSDLPPPGYYIQKYPDLNGTGRIFWGLVDPDTLRMVFGTRSVPSIYVFAPDGRLIYKSTGEFNIRSLAGLIGGHDSAEPEQADQAYSAN